MALFAYWPYQSASPIQKAWPYIVTVPAIGTALPLSLVKTHLRINPAANFAQSLIGTFNVTNSSQTITGVNSNISMQLVAGQQILISNVQYIVQTLISNTQFTITIPYSGSTSSGITINVDPEDEYLIGLMYSAMDFCEGETRRDLLIKTYMTYRDAFDWEISTVLRRSKLQSFIRLEYLNQGVWTTVDPSIYYTDSQTDYSSIYLVYNKEWPYPIDVQFQAVRASFTAGYGSDYTSVPYELQLGMVNHIANMYANRGDCSGGTSCNDLVPMETKRAYNRFKIFDITGDDYSARFG
jgi:uncharacterized phiE125 gp8 family phage protein